MQGLLFVLWPASLSPGMFHSRVQIDKHRNHCASSMHTTIVHVGRKCYTARACKHINLCAGSSQQSMQCASLPTACKLVWQQHPGRSEHSAHDTHGTHTAGGMSASC